MFDLNIFSNQVISILVGVATSWLFLIILFLYFRPRIDISPQIARRDRNYRVKIINKTSFFDLSDISVQFDLATCENGVTRLHSLPLVTSNLTFLGKYDKQDKTTSYARRFRIESNLSTLQITPPEEFFRFRIFARHSFSGLGKSFYQDYVPSSIQTGDFVPGDSFDIINEESS